MTKRKNKMEISIPENTTQKIKNNNPAKTEVNSDTSNLDRQTVKSCYNSCQGYVTYDKKIL